MFFYFYTSGPPPSDGDNTQIDVKDLDFFVFLIYADKPDGKYTKAPLDPTPSDCKVPRNGYGN